MAEIIEINGLSAPGLEVFTRLTEAQLRRSLEPELGIFIAEGEKVTGHALDAGCEPLSLLVERKHIAGKARELIERCGVPVYTGERDVLAGLTGSYFLETPTGASIVAADLIAFAAACAIGRVHRV